MGVCFRYSGMRGCWYEGYVGIMVCWYYGMRILGGWEVERFRRVVGYTLYIQHKHKHTPNPMYISPKHAHTHLPAGTR